MFFYIVFTYYATFMYFFYKIFSFVFSLPFAIFIYFLLFFFFSFLVFIFIKEKYVIYLKKSKYQMLFKFILAIIFLVFFYYLTKGDLIFENSYFIQNFSINVNNFFYNLLSFLICPIQFLKIKYYWNKKEEIFYKFLRGPWGPLGPFAPFWKRTRWAAPDKDSYRWRGQKGPWGFHWCSWWPGYTKSKEFQKERRGTGGIHRGFIYSWPPGVYQAFGYDSLKKKYYVIVWDSVSNIGHELHFRRGESIYVFHGYDGRSWAYWTSEDYFAIPKKFRVKYMEITAEENQTYENMSVFDSRYLEMILVVYLVTLKLIGWYRFQ